MLNRITRLDMNEVPYPPPKKIIEAAQRGLSHLNRYAEPKELEWLQGLLADYSGVSKRHVVLSPGSNLLLREAIHIFSKGRKAITVSPSFLPTIQAAKQFSTKLVTIRLSPPEFDLDPELVMDMLNEPSLVIIDNPNNPTGNILLNRKMVEAIVENTDILLVIDEAYYEFSKETFVDMVQNHSNLAITRTMDKAFSLAGARIGYLVAGEAFLDAFSSLYAILPRPSLYAAIEALNNPDYMRENVNLVIKERERLRKSLNKLGVHVYPSNTNFLLIKTKILDIAKMLRDIGVFISDLSNQLSPGFIRVSIGTREENDTFIAGYTKILEACT
ncbi:MAG: histidinol-phosphate aminotransferase family protein [Deltaproteobacteria bacterium]|nr:histidinol-phosphate aminotransferase family protein [Deltaproteobacteria bacterium]